MRTYIQINPADNVAVAVEDLHAGMSLDINGKTLIVQQDIPAGHKVALQDFEEGDYIIKYGAPIGHARMSVATGCWVNEKNIKTNLEGLSEYEFTPQPIPEQPSRVSLTFKGYRRKNGDVGIRNEIWIIPAVGCVNGITRRLADELQRETQGAGVDAIVAYPHNYGCSQLGDDHENTRKILRDMVLHPNAGQSLLSVWGARTTRSALSVSCWENTMRNVFVLWKRRKLPTNWRREWNSCVSFMQSLHKISGRMSLWANYMSG